jgi:cation diffusion facilitator family transporter
LEVRKAGFRIGPKEKVALISLLAAVLLVTTKLAVGLWTNSLGILSEALHSGIDLIAAAMTLVAVKMGDRPPDRDHQYGHQKIESLSSLFETALLFITCIWIVYEAFRRLFFTHETPDIGIMAVLVMLMSIGVDYSRSRALMRTAKQFKSQALEADAIHFKTDLISSVIVLIGILLTWVGLKNVDAVAALGVAAVTAYIGYNMWKKSVHTLLDGAPEGIPEQVKEEAMKVKGVYGVGTLRVRESGHATFIDAVILIDRKLPLEQANRISHEISDRVNLIVPNADLVIHAEPYCLESNDLVERIRSETSNFENVHSVHNILITEEECQFEVDLHVEVDSALTIEEAHAICTKLEGHILDIDPKIKKVVTHIEPANAPTGTVQVVADDTDEILRSVSDMARSMSEVRSCSDISVRRLNGRLKLNMCCQFDRTLSVLQVHDVVDRLENAIKVKHADIETIYIHMEPCDDPPLVQTIADVPK